jgi:hypothetical protein
MGMIDLRIMFCKHTVLCGFRYLGMDMPTLDVLYSKYLD